jgi:hypothetical protein
MEGGAVDGLVRDHSDTKHGLRLIIEIGVQLRREEIQAFGGAEIE